MTAAAELADLRQQLAEYARGLRAKLATYEPITPAGVATFVSIEVVATEIEAILGSKPPTPDSEPCTRCGKVPTNRGAPGRRWCSAICEVAWWGERPDEPEFDELELTLAALRSYVNELRERKNTCHSVEAGLAVGRIADEIEARFLVKFSVKTSVNNEAWREVAQVSGDPGLEVVIHEVSITPRGLEPGYSIRSKE